MTKIQTKTGNLLHVTSGHIVHGCNAQGVMGSGVALGVKNTYPGAFENYLMHYKRNDLKLGVAYPYRVNGELMIWNAVTQQHYGSGKRFTNYEAIATCFEQIEEFITSAGTPTEIHIPLIGSDRGGGKWEIVREIIEQTVTCPVTLWVLPTKD